MKRLLQALALTGALSPMPNLAMQTFTLANGKRLIVEKGDITHCHTDAIVNAANEQLLGGAGVCGAIFNAAGWDTLQAACNRYPINNGVRCPVGQARITESGHLQSRGIHHIIHAVGPDCRIIKNAQQQDLLLSQAYQSSLTLADQHGLTSLAFPFISSAIYAFPKDRAATIALTTVIGFLKNSDSNISSVYFVLFDQRDHELFVRKASTVLS